ncbi:MAG: hypothetical protein A3G24_19490 [Betaproteobacteria bacterium RIFCSPLOWO2_12_FULL_62_13]|nr:MAG: hypothetical protein A3G24_19490 [Betaproteobacteria bacterium RIFCSPLOWO2_12_FULL_62_13]
MLDNGLISIQAYVRIHSTTRRGDAAGTASDRGLPMNGGTGLFKLGDVFRHTLTVTPELMHRFQSVSGDSNPIHLDDRYAAARGFRGIVVYGNLLGAMVSHLVGMKLPTHEVIILSESLEFRKPSYVGEEIRLEATVARVHEAVMAVSLRLAFFSPAGEKVCTGQCVIKCL